MEEEPQKLDVSEWEVLKIMYQMFGVRRTAELLGWAFIWSAKGYKSIKEVREDLEARGLSRSTAFRAVAELRELREELERQAGREVPIPEVLEEIKKVA